MDPLNRGCQIQMRSVLSVVALVTFLFLVLLTSVGADSPLLSRYYGYLIAVGVLLSTLLAVLVFYQLQKLYKWYRSRAFGSRFMTRLVILMSVTALLPGVSLYLVSVQFVSNSISSWFDVRVENALNSGVRLGKVILVDMLADLKRRGQEALINIVFAKNKEVVTQNLYRLIEQAHLDSVSIMNAQGTSSIALSPGVILFPDAPPIFELQRSLKKGGYGFAKPFADNSLGLRVILPFVSQYMGATQQFLVLTVRVPRAITHTLNSVEDVNRDYMRLVLAQHGLQRVYQVALTLAILLALLFAVSVSIYYGHQLSQSLLMLAQGTQAVAQGDFSPRAMSGGQDELSMLTRSFNQMIYQLNEARELARKKSQQVEQEREYLANLLAKMTAGVMTFNQDFFLCLANDSARTILENDLQEVWGQALPSWRGGLYDFSARIMEGFLGIDTVWCKQITLKYQGGQKHLVIRGACIQPSREGQFVVVFDDMTPIVHAQKMIAWSEVAQRVAHEIKNPLTPIQLSAERLQLRIADRLSQPDQAMFNQSIRTIIEQVSAMKELVDGFRSLTKVPKATVPVVASFDLRHLIEGVLGLYERDGLSIVKKFSTQSAIVIANSRQIRQVLLNILSNAEEATVGVVAPEITVVTHVELHRVCLIIRDNGCGFSEAALLHAFEPYVTSKSRGTGLGLVIVKKIIDEQDGVVHVENVMPSGAQVTIYLRRAIEN